MTRVSSRRHLESSTSSTTLGGRLWRWLPSTANDRRVRIAGWLSFIGEVLIIGTGGAVRLTGSGLGCSEWPLCTPESLVPIPEHGIHGFIEFGNRTMTGLVGILALAVLFSVIRFRAERRDLFVLSVVVLGGVLAQAVVGGITVLTKLNPFIVGFHYVASLTLVCVTAAFLVRLTMKPGPRELTTPRWYAVLAHVTGIALVFTIFFGVLTTGSGPHSGDADIRRHGFDASILAHVHSVPGYVLATLVVVLVIGALLHSLPQRRWALTLMGAILVQIVVGVLQARDGLPPVLVGIHLILAALTAATYTTFVMNVKQPVADRV